jgi:peptidoglycan/LPS O-acetylase OafA/YrhL
MRPHAAAAKTEHVEPLRKEHTMVASATGSETGARGKPRVPRLDGIRGICAILVVLTHVAFATIVLSSDFGEPPEGIWSILAAGQVGAIGPFFILSGLLLYRPFARAAIAGTPYPKLGPFFIRRAARLLPAFWLLVATCLLVLNLSSINGLWDVLRPFLLLHYYDFTFYAGLDVTWTVPTETQFYLALPLLAWLMTRLARGGADPARKARRMMVPLALMVVVQFGWTAYIHSQLGPWPPQFFWPFSISGLFAIGMALAIWSVLAELSPERPPALFRAAVRRPNLFWLGALAAYAINCAQPFSTPGTADWLSPEAALVRHAMLLSFSFLVMVPLVVPNASSRLMEAVLSNLPTRYLGRISYGVYLWHFVVMYLVFESGSIFGAPPVPVQVLLGQFGFWELMLPVVAGTIAVASVSYYLLERPVIRLGERIIASRWSPGTAIAGAGGRPRMERV